MGGIVRPENHGVATRNPKHLSKRDSAFLPSYLAAPADIGGRIAPFVSPLASSTVHRVFIILVGDLVLDVTPGKLSPVIVKLRADGSRFNLDLLSKAILGNRGAAHRMEATATLIECDNTDYVSLKVSAVIGPHASYGHAVAVGEAVKKLLSLYRFAAAPSTLINLDMEGYRNLDLIVDVFV